MQALDGVSKGNIVECRDQNNNVFFQTASSHHAGSVALFEFSPAGLTAREAQLNAGLRGVSRTARMSEEQRMNRCDERTGRALPPEDAIERAQAKVREFGKLIEVSRREVVVVMPSDELERNANQEIYQ